jgi:hypothetical protein
VISISILGDKSKVDKVERESSKVMEECRTGSGLTAGYLPLECERPAKSLPVLNSVLAG